MKLAPPSFEATRAAIESACLFRSFGRVSEIVGLVIEADGPNAKVGDHVLIESVTGTISGEVVGVRGERTLIMPLGELTGLRAGDLVYATGRSLQVKVGPSLLGRTVDGLCEPIDGKGPITCYRNHPSMSSPPPALNRRLIEHPMPTGVRAIDGLLTLGEGQRIGIFAGSGVGKSTLLGMIARGCEADVNVIALIGERGREVREFIERDLGTEGLRKSVIVCATADQAPLVRIKAAWTATAIAEAFRDEGKRVLLMMDSVTRFCMAQREVGLAIGEPPSTKGYTPSVFALLPRLIERAGNSAVGSITAIYTVLVEGDDTNEPIADSARAILDGHIVLDRTLTSKGHYPPIDPLASLSRTMPATVGAEQMESARKLREWIAAYSEVEDLVAIGAYSPGSKPIADTAISKWSAISAFLRQRKDDSSTWLETITKLKELTDA